MQILPFIVLLALMYVLLVRPQQQRVRRQRALISSLEVGDEVVTAGGVLGRIVGLDGEEARLEVAPGITMAFLRAAITRRTGPDTSPDTGAAGEPAPPEQVEGDERGEDR